MRLLLAALALVLASSASAQGHADYVGGTAARIDSGTSGAIDVSDPHYFAFYAKKTQVRVAYDRINVLEYGQKVDRRILTAALITLANPAAGMLLLLGKKRSHYLTVGYTDEDGAHQALVFRVDKNGIRATLASLQARTGVRIEYQDEQARKAGPG
jgi:hypothetical protein